MESKNSFEDDRNFALDQMGATNYGFFLKNFFDKCLALILFICFMPLIIPLSVFLFFYNRGEVIFSQKRIGYQEKPFMIYKFCTMKKGAVTDDPEITPFGSLLRKYSLDELPQLWNVLLGDMSMVGPRPLYPEYLPHYNHEHVQRHKVKPGITGLAQISGRNDLGWQERFDLDVIYVRTHSLTLDLRILMKTFAIVLRAKGADSAQKGLKPFQGYQNQ